MLAPTGGRADQNGIERRVLEIVGGLAAELSGPLSRSRVGLNASLDRDLGIDSLGRVELLLRLEQALGVRLPDAVMAGAETPRNLADAIRAAAPAAEERLGEAAPPVGPGRAVPPDTATLVEALEWQARTHPDRVHILLRREDGTEVPIRYGTLQARARAVAAGLRERGFGPGHSIALMLPTEPAFFEVFFGVLLAGAVPVPIYPPFRPDRIEEYANRQAGILRNAEASLLVTFGPAERVARLLRGRVPSLQDVTPSEKLSRPESAASLPRPRGEDPALIQYTSGSTGAPKGVLLSHANLLANIRASGEALAIGPGDIGASWLPLYHDMGLIGAWLTPLWYGIPVAIMSPLAFLSRPARWLWTIHTHRATLSPAPNFAFDLCARKVTDAEIAGLDLSSWRLALNGSEPVSPETLERFIRRFAPYGFRPEAMSPVYGLAEASLALTVPPMGRVVRLDRVAREPFQSRREARPAAPGESHVLRFVSCGRPIRGHEIRILDEEGRPVGERVEGRIEFSGPSVTSGYYRNPEATRAVLRGGWMDSGDLGYWAGGELFITGRRKDVIIKAGRNFYPHEIEEAVGEVPGIRKGCVAAFGLVDPEAGTERLVVVAESRETAPDRIEALRAAVLDRVVTVIGIPPDAVAIAPRGAVLKTSSGKIRRSAVREAYRSGDLLRGAPAVPAQWAKLLIRNTGSWLRRIGGRLASLAYAAYVGLLLGAAAPVLWVLLLVLPGGRPAHRLARVWCRGMLALSGCSLRVEGLENLQGPIHALLAANHASYVDSLVLLAALPVEFRFVAKRELLFSPMIGTAIRKMGHLTVARGDPSSSAADAEKASAALRKGVSLLFFPEGTFSSAPGLLPFRLGAFKAAVEAGRPVIPIGLRGTRAVLPGRTWRPKPGRISVAIGSPIPPRGGGWPEMVRLRDLTRTRIARLAGEDADEPLPS